MSSRSRQLERTSSSVVLQENPSKKPKHVISTRLNMMGLGLLEVGKFSPHQSTLASNLIGYGIAATTGYLLGYASQKFEWIGMLKWVYNGRIRAFTLGGAVLAACTGNYTTAVFLVSAEAARTIEISKMRILLRSKNYDDLEKKLERKNKGQK